MGFYEELSKYYDIIFPTGEPQVKFIEKRAIDSTNHILDIACGTGNYSISLAEKGFHVTAFDLDEEMVGQAKEKAKIKGLQLATFVGDMKRLEEYFQKDSFHIAFCIGNSLVHLTRLEEIQEALNQIYGVLKKGGQFILQIINYDRIIKYNIDGLPTIEDQERGVKFIRKYIYEEEKHLIHFNTELIITKGEGVESYSNSVPLYPLQSHQLVGMLQNAGFSNIQLYGNFMEEEYKEESYATVVAAEK